MSQNNKPTYKPKASLLENYHRLKYYKHMKNKAYTEYDQQATSSDVPMDLKIKNNNALNLKVKDDSESDEYKSAESAEECLSPLNLVKSRNTDKTDDKIQMINNDNFNRHNKILSHLDNKKEKLNNHKKVLIKHSIREICEQNESVENDIDVSPNFETVDSCVVSKDLKVFEGDVSNSVVIKNTLVNDKVGMIVESSDKMIGKRKRKRGQLEKEAVEDQNKIVKKNQDDFEIKLNDKQIIVEESDKIEYLYEVKIGVIIKVPEDKKIEECISHKDSEIKSTVDIGQKGDKVELVKDEVKNQNTLKDIGGENNEDHIEQCESGKEESDEKIDLDGEIGKDAEIEQQNDEILVTKEKNGEDCSKDEIRSKEESIQKVHNKNKKISDKELKVEDIKEGFDINESGMDEISEEEMEVTGPNEKEEEGENEVTEPNESKVDDEQNEIDDKQSEKIDNECEVASDLSVRGSEVDDKGSDASADQSEQESEVDSKSNKGSNSPAEQSEQLSEVDNKSDKGSNSPADQSHQESEVDEQSKRCDRDAKEPELNENINNENDLDNKSDKGSETAAEQSNTSDKNGEADDLIKRREKKMEVAEQNKNIDKESKSNKQDDNSEKDMESEEQSEISDSETKVDEQNDISDKGSKSDKNSDKESDKDINSDEESNIDKNSDKKSYIDKNSDKEIDMDINSDKESNIDKNCDEESDMVENSDKETNVDKNSDKKSYIDKNSVKEIDIDINSDKESNIDKNSDEESDVDKNSDKESEVDDQNDQAGSSGKDSEGEMEVLNSDNETDEKEQNEMNKEVDKSEKLDQVEINKEGDNLENNVQRGTEEADNVTGEEAIKSINKDEEREKISGLNYQNGDIRENTSVVAAGDFVEECDLGSNDEGSNLEVEGKDVEDVEINEQLEQTNKDHKDRITEGGFNESHEIVSENMTEEPQKESPDDEGVLKEKISEIGSQELDRQNVTKKHKESSAKEESDSDVIICEDSDNEISNLNPIGILDKGIKRTTTTCERTVKRVKNHSTTSSSSDSGSSSDSETDSDSSSETSSNQTRNRQHKLRLSRKRQIERNKLLQKKLIHKKKREIVINDLNENKDDRPLKCDICRYTCKIPGTLRKHKAKDHPDINRNNMLYSCTQCSYVNTFKEDMKKHIDNKHDGRCGYNVVTQNNGRNDYYNNEFDFFQVEIPYPCRYCNYVTTMGFDMQDHMYYRHRDIIESINDNRKKRKYSSNYYICRCCDFQTRYPDIFDEHVSKSHAKRTYRCNHCSYTTLRKCEMNKHKASIHETDSLRICNLCSFRTTRQSHLSRHILLKHTNEYVFSCRYCSYKTTSTKSFKHHVQMEHT